MVYQREGEFYITYLGVWLLQVTSQSVLQLSLLLFVSEKLID